MPQPNNEPTIKAGALLCPVCCIEYTEIEADFEIEGTIIHNIKVLRCPICQDEQLKPGQQEQIERKIPTPNPPNLKQAHKTF